MTNTRGKVFNVLLLTCSRYLTLVTIRPPFGVTCPLKPWFLPSQFSVAHPPSPLITVSSHLCLRLMGSPCFGSIADVVQSHGGVFMDSSYPSSPVTGPLSRGQRRSSETSLASQVSGMADSYTSTNIANSKCSQYQHARLSLSSTHTNTCPVTLPVYFFSFSKSSLFLSLSISISLSHSLSFFLFLSKPHYSDSTHTLQFSRPDRSFSNSA